MKVYLKCLLSVLTLLMMLSGVSLYTASADNTYTQNNEFIFGDVDMDGVITVKDATAIQKGVAGLDYLTGVQKVLADPENIGVSVKNATAIQKYIAGIRGEYTFFIDKKVDMPKLDEFSKYVSVDADFCDDTIIVSQKESIDGVYCLKDFPEYDFESVKLMGEPRDGMIKFYEITLKNPGKENVVEAIEALDYRANLDLLAVSPGGYYTQD